ncbi:MAG: Arm DNA-binding domain-containing protein [Tissierellia bacterium]|nr:Arm DNA-binding domain-containing protein [Tissierellia bacterium]
MKYTFRISFFLKKSIVRKNGKSPIIARITLNGEKVEFSTKLNLERSCKAYPQCTDGSDVVFTLQEVSRGHSILCRNNTEGRCGHRPNADRTVITVTVFAPTAAHIKR